MTARQTRAEWNEGQLRFPDAALSPVDALWRDCPLLAILANPEVAFHQFDDFCHYVSAEAGITAVISNSGTATITAGAGGVMQLGPSDGTVTDNDEIYIGGTYTVITPAAGKDIWFEARVKLTEANVDDANVIVGLSSTYAANTLQDDGAGPPANYSGIVLFKVDGGTVWQAECSAAAAQTANTSLATRQSGSYQRLGFKVNGLSSVTFYIDGVAVGTISTNLPTAAMGLILGLKNGFTNEEFLDIDWLRLVQLR